MNKLIKEIVAVFIDICVVCFFAIASFILTVEFSEYVSSFDLVVRVMILTVWVIGLFVAFLNAFGVNWSHINFEEVRA